jgi:hypothetical protein
MENEKRIDGIYALEKEPETIEGLEKKREEIMKKYYFANNKLNYLREEKGVPGDRVKQEMDKLVVERVAISARIQELKLRRDVKKAIEEEKEGESLTTQWKLNESYIKLLQTKADILKNKHILGDDGEDYKNWKKYTDKIKQVKEKQGAMENRLEQIAEKMILNK